MKLLIMIFSTGGILMGCNSFNKYPDQNPLIIKPSIPLIEESLSIPSEKHHSPPVTIIKKVEVGCPMYVLPPLPKTPALPYKELEAVPPNDQAALDRIQQKHLDELRLYISKLKLLLTQTHRAYVVKCEAFMKGRK